MREREKALALALAGMCGLLECDLLINRTMGEAERGMLKKALADARLLLYGPPSEPAPHDFDTCEDRDCALCSEYYGGRDDGGSCQDEDSRFAPLIDPEKERAKLARRTP